MKKNNLIIFVCILLFLTACSMEDFNKSMFSKKGFYSAFNITFNETEITEPAFTINAVEGELIRLNPTAIDPDGDFVTYSFSKPFDKNGRWQTVLGDEGEYLTAVTASDGKEKVSVLVKVIVKRANRAPTIDCKKEIVVDEGSIVDLSNYCKVFDVDGDKIVLSYSGWVNSAKKEITFSDSGVHYVTIKASDGESEIFESLKVIVQDVNREPVFHNLPDMITVMEGDKIKIEPYVTDPDGDNIKIIFGHPLSNKGEWQTSLGDAGRYEANVLATDGINSVVRKVILDITMKNTAPVLKPISDIVVEEGDVVRLDIEAYDREKDKIEILISGWMTSQERKTDYDDAGEYTVKVTATDGFLSTEQIVHITIKDKNRPPYFIKSA